MDQQSLSDALGDILAQMNTDEWDDLLQAAAPAQKKALLKAKGDVSDLRLRLGNQILQTMADGFKANEQAFLDGQAAAQKALGQCENAETILNAVGDFLEVALKAASCC